MNLSELITKLETYPADKKVSNGFAESMSYRGYYEQLAFEPKQDTTIGAMLHEAKAALGRIFQGYKGGDYLMTGYSRVHVCAYGTSNDGDDSMAELFAEIDNELMNALQLQVERLTAERDALKADALRYRWLLTNNATAYLGKYGTAEIRFHIDNIEVKRAWMRSTGFKNLSDTIDAARKEGTA